MSCSPRVHTLAAMLACGVGFTSASLQQIEPNPGGAPDVVYIPTPSEVVTVMLRMANVGPGDVVYDLGSGDGRIVIAASYRTRSI